MIAGTGLAATLPASGALAATAQRSKYIHAVALAHARTDISAEMISETFGIRPGAARRYLSQLVRNGVVDVPNPSGIARLAKPLQRIVPEVVEYNPAGGYVVRGRLDELTAKAREMAERVLRDDGSETSEDAVINAPDPDPDAPEAENAKAGDDDPRPDTRP